MNKQEIFKWIEEAKYITTSRLEYDESSNRWESRIYKKGSQLYSVGFCNKEPMTKSNSKSKGPYYEPTLVKKIQKKIVETTYEPIEPLKSQ